VVPVAVGGGNDALDERGGVVHGSAKGLDPSTRAVHGRADLGLPAPGRQSSSGADLDGDGFPDFVTSVQGSMVSDGNVVAARTN
jgi:hypothetical protein